MWKNVCSSLTPVANPPPEEDRVNIWSLKEAGRRASLTSGWIASSTKNNGNEVVFSVVFTSLHINNTFFREVEQWR